MLVTEENFEIVLMALQGADRIGVDTETTGLNVRNKVDYLTGICVAVDGLEAYLPFRHPEGNLPMHYTKYLQAVFNEKDLDWHHRKFDMHSLKTIGIDPLEFTGKQFDAGLMFHLWNEEIWDRRLDALGTKYLKMGKSPDADAYHDFGQTFGYKNIPVNLAWRYGGRDATVTTKLCQWVWPKLVEQDLDKVYLETEMPFTRVLYKLEQRGVGVDKEFAKKKYDAGTGRMVTIFRELGYNPASTKDLKNVLLDELKLPVFAHTPKCEECKRGQPVDNHEGTASFNKKAMEEYDDLLQVMDQVDAKRISEYRGWQKATSSLYKPLLDRTGPDGFIRTEFRQDGTVTGRLSAAEPNLQQVPRSTDKPWNGNAKSAFTSGRPGYVLIGWDYSQLELRLAAAYGQETELLEEFKKPDSDVFTLLTPKIFGEFSPEFRHQTKNGFVYPNLYGAGIPKISRTIGKSLEETTMLFNNYKASIPGIMKVSSQVSTLVEQRGFVKYWDGRRRHIRNKHKAYKAWNSVCQGGAAQLVKKAMLRCEEFEDENCLMVLQVHDEITFIIKEDMVSIYEPKIVDAMTNWPEFGVTLAVEGKVWK